MPTITAVLPTYRRPQFLTRAIQSVRAQSWTDLKIVVKDNDPDGDSPVSRELLDTEPRIVYIKNAVNIGPYENFRTGIRNVDTEFFSLLSDDDYLEPDFYKQAMRLFEEYPTAGFVAFRVDLVSVDGHPLGTSYPGYKGSDAIGCKYYEPVEGFEGFMRGAFPATWTGFVFRSEVAQAIDMGDFAETGLGGDIRFIWRAASRFPFVITNQKAANFTLHSGSYAEGSPFDERFHYWLRQRFVAILTDPLVESEIKKKIYSYYCGKAGASMSSIKYYSCQAAALIARRIKAGQREELKFDLRAMKFFLPLGLPHLLRALVSLALWLKLETRIRRILKSHT